MQVLMNIALSKIKLSEPKRNPGNIKELAESIKKEGLLQPLVVNQYNELICGRRRFEAIKMLGWTEVPVNQIKTESDIDKLLKTIAENIMWKNLTWQEEVRQKMEVYQLMCQKYGHIKGRPKKSSDSEHFWNIEKTAKSFNQSKEDFK